MLTIPVQGMLKAYGPNGKAGTTQQSFMRVSDASLRVLLHSLANTVAAAFYGLAKISTCCLS